MISRILYHLASPEGVAIVGAAALLLGLLVGYMLTRSAWATRLARELSLAEQHKHDSLQLMRAGFDEQQKSLLCQFESLSAKILQNNIQHLKSGNREDMQALLRDLKPRLDALGHAVQASHDANVSAKASLDEQIRQMIEQTRRLDHEAAALTRALKGDTKVQGDWGETVLERMLEMGGLRKNEEFFMQYVARDDRGKIIRPDAVICLPEERRIIIDAKVSLTHFSNYMAAEDEAEREALLNAHYKSVQAHVKELAAKNYSRHIPGALEHVLMFIPNESSYIAAMQYAREALKTDLQRFACDKGIIISSPSNLLVAINIARHLWKKQWQEENKDILSKLAQDVYAKCELLIDTVSTLDRQLATAQNTCTKALSQLNTGRSSLINSSKALVGAADSHHEGEADTPPLQD